MVVWMAVVFIASTDLGAEAHTSQILLPLMRWLVPNLSPSGFEEVQFFVRKAGHVTEYAVLALLILRALRILRGSAGAGWSWSLALWALGASAAYGATDEFHQYFVPSRGPSVRDVLIDSCGAALGLVLAFLWIRRRSHAAQRVGRA